MPLKGMIVLAVSASITSACAWMTPSLAPGIRANAGAYHEVVSDFNDEVILANIIRAKNYVPLNISELSTITGNLSEQASLGLSVPFGKTYGSNTRSTATPALQLGSSPTFSMAPLNTQGFTLNIIQPIAPMYLLSKWNTGISRDVLLLLFIKEIQFADDIEYAQGADGKETSRVAARHRYRNNPNSPEEEKAFLALIADMRRSLEIKTMSVLEPVGPEFPFLTAAAADRGSQPQSAVAALTLIAGMGDAQYHVGNFDKAAKNGQLYRSYPSQVALCIDDSLSDGNRIYSQTVLQHLTEVRKSRAKRVSESLCTSAGTLDVACQSNFLSENLKFSNPGGLALLYLSGHGGGNSGSGNTTGLNNGGTNSGGTNPGANTGGAGRSSGAPGGSSGPTVTSVMQANRISAVLQATDCEGDQIVLEPSSESDFKEESQGFAHIEWRSISEVFQYLGAVSRNAGLTQWTTVPDTDIKTVGSPAKASYQEVLFRLGTSGTLEASYGGVKYGVSQGISKEGESAINDHSLEVLALLSELVNTAKVSSDIPVTQQLQILP
jgi:hypothetical protein